MTQDTPPSTPHKYQLEEGVDPAPYPNRILADMADYLVILPLISLGTAMVFGEGREVTSPAVVAAVTIFGVYEVLGVALFGKTLGRKALGVAVRRNPDGGKVNFGQALVRWLLKTWTPFAWLAAAWTAAASGAQAIATVGQLLIVATIFLGPYRRGWHDRVLRTIVVSDKPKPAATTPA